MVSEPSPSRSVTPSCVAETRVIGAVSIIQPPRKSKSMRPRTSERFIPKVSIGMTSTDGPAIVPSDGEQCTDIGRPRQTSLFNYPDYNV
jgi:hypothetical protein